MPGKLAGCRRYAVYYGPGDPKALEGYDLVVLAPDAWPDSLRREAQERGARLLAYLSVLEVPGAIPPPDAALRVNEMPVRNEAWGNWVLDPRHPRTRDRLLHQVARLRDSGWDGLFLDTIGAVEDPALPPDLQSRLIPAAACLVAATAAAWPDGALVQNWGFGPLLPLVAPYLDGLCWEDFTVTGGPLCDRLSAWSRNGGLRVLALNERPQDAALLAAAAETRGFLWYGALGSYLALPPRCSS